jgi:FkbH-like protein
MSSGVSQSSGEVDIRIAANFTIEPIEEFLAGWMSALGIASAIRIAPYNQVFQQLLEGGLLRTNLGGINLIALDLDAWLPAESIADAQPKLERAIKDFVSMLRSASANGASGAVLIFPAAGEPIRPAECAAAVAAAKASLLAQCPTISGWTALDLTAAIQLYSVTDARDPFTDELGNIPFTEEMYAAAATAAARWIRATCTKPRKVIVLDADNTLWQGIYGEGTMEVTQPYRLLHEFMLQQREKGILLTLVSKNNEADVIESALQSESSVLRPEHFTAWRINWQAKSENLRALSEELGLALNTFILVDDSSYECMEVRNQCPEVLAIQLPSSPQAIPHFVDHMWVFDQSAVTEEDRNRSILYQAERQRHELSKQAMTTEEFLESLHIKIEFAPCSEGDLARVAQLTQRTTQFNTTGIWHTEKSLSSALSAGGHECYIVRVRDIFGDYGLVGAVLFKSAGSSMQIDLFLVSCRALGRRVEDHVIEQLKSLAIQRGADRLIIPVVPTARNRPVREFLERLCGVSADTQEPFECVLSATDKASEWRSTKSTTEVQPPSTSAPKLPVVSDEEGKLMQIASELQTAAAIITSFRMKKKPRPSTAGPLIPPSNALEQSLVRIWSDCLEVEPIGIRDNFFDFGGHSLRATRVLTRVRSEFGVELSLTALFKTPTIEAMATELVEMLSLKSSVTAS